MNHKKEPIKWALVSVTKGRHLLFTWVDGHVRSYRLHVPFKGSCKYESERRDKTKWERERVVSDWELRDLYALIPWSTEPMPKALAVAEEKELI